MQNQSLRIVFTGGGSGGPTTPLLAVYDELIHKIGKNQVKAVFWGTLNGPEKKMVQTTDLPFESIPAGKWRRYWSWKNLIDPFFIFLGFVIGIVKLLRFRPQVVVSAGSFVSVPIAYAAWLLRIPHVILQMDIRPGLANRLMAPVSNGLAYLFEQSASHFPSIERQKIGPVVRSEIREASADKANTQFNLKPDRPVLLVTGGGQGAFGLNKAVASVLELWLEHFQVVHLTGSEQTDVRHTHPDYHPYSFINEGMGHLLARSSLIVTRAGLGILGELAYLAKDAILVPIPGSHQELNSAVLVKAGAAISLSQKQFLEKGEIWWEDFLNEYQPGLIGQKLHALLPPGGTEMFTEMILQYSSRSPK